MHACMQVSTTTLERPSQYKPSAAAPGEEAAPTAENAAKRGSVRGWVGRQLLRRWPWQRDAGAAPQAEDNRGSAEAAPAKASSKTKTASIVAGSALDMASSSYLESLYRFTDDGRRLSAISRYR